MRSSLSILLVGAVTAAAVGLVTGQGWPGYVVGAVLALALWVMLLCGSAARPDQWTVRPRDYALAAIAGVVLGGAIFHLGEENAAFWASGFIISGVLVPSTSAAMRRAE